MYLRSGCRGCCSGSTGGALRVGAGAGGGAAARIDPAIRALAPEYIRTGAEASLGGAVGFDFEVADKLECEVEFVEVVVLLFGFDFCLAFEDDDVADDDDEGLELDFEEGVIVVSIVSPESRRGREREFEFGFET